MKLRYIILIIICIIISGLIGGYFIFDNSLKLKGNNNVECNYKTKYKDSGYTFKLLGKDLSNKVKVKSNVNVNKMGKYKITYSVNYLFITIKKERIIIVKDLQKPIIELKGTTDIITCPDKEYIEEGYIATDNLDGDITNKVEKNIVDNKIIYKVKDSSNNEFEINRNIIYEDKEKPQLTLKGNSSIVVNINSTYKDSGYSVKDNCDDSINVITEGSVNTSVIGTYYITYKATDKSGNTTSVTRTVKVEKLKTGYIYLTFDDGPGAATANILNTLKNKGVKATFFVTGSGSDELIKREYNEGHTIALHTNSHVYSKIYSSVDAYFEDLDKVADRVYRLTGTKPNIIRFPGGSNNTVSNKYSKNIMDTLTKEVVNRGYNYFDWNITSGDAGGCSNSTCIYNNVVNNLSRDRNNIVLMHDIKWNTANILGDIIDYCKSNNYEFRVITTSTPAVRFK